MRGAPTAWRSTPWHCRVRADLPGQPYQKGVVFSLLNLGFIAAQSANYSSALSLFLEARAILETAAVPQPEQLRMLLFKELGWVYINLGDLPQAFDLLFQALKISQETGSADVEAGVQNSLSIAYSENGDLDASVAALRHAITFLEKSDQRRDYCIALNNLAMTLLDQKLLDEALVYADASLKIARQMNYPSLLATTLDTTSQIHLARHEYSLAEDLLNQALGIHAGFGNDLAELYLNLARIKMGQGQMSAAPANLAPITSVRRGPRG